MDLVTQRRCLTGLAGALLAGTAGAIAWSVSAIELPETSASMSPSTNLPAAVPSGVSDSAVDDARFDSLELRSPLYDPSPPQRPVVKPPRPVTPPAPKKPTLSVTLVGTVIDNDGRLAILADPSGKFDVKGVGESLELTPDGMTVKKIESESVTLEYNGRTLNVPLDRSLKKRGGSGNRANKRRREN